jgi:hypothetical protein
MRIAIISDIHGNLTALDAVLADLLITDDKPEIRRVEYDVEKEASRLLASHYPLNEWLAETRRRGAYLPPPVANNGLLH